MLKLFKYLKPYTGAAIMVIVLVFLQCMADLYLPTLMADIINNGIIRPDRLAAITGGPGGGDIPYILTTGALMLLVSLGGAACAVSGGYFSARLAMGFGEILRRKVFTHVSVFSLHEFDKIGTPSLVTRNTNDITQIQMVTFVIFRMMIAAPIMCVGGVILALSKDTGLAWVIIAALPVLAIAILIVAAKGFPLFRAIQKKIDRINMVIRENLSGIRVIRAFNREDREQRRFTEANRDLTKTAITVNRMMAVIMPIVLFVMNITIVGITWFGALRIQAGQTDVGNMMAFVQYTFQILFSLVMASMLLIMVPRAQASAERINEVLDTRPEISDPDSPVQPPADQHGCIEFRDVSFSYFGAEEPAVSDITFAARPGEVTAIIGSTGSGKTTLLNLIPRFYDASHGTVLIDNTDIRSMNQEDIRSKIGLVPQKAVLFSGTIEDNIRFGREDASDDDVHRASDIAQATEFITALPEGFNAVVAQGGTNLSGGQKQRLAIARALLRRPEIYLFDDSFSALDFKTDALLRAALRREIKDATVIIVGQRVATIRDADRIIVLDEGRIAGLGTHRELYKTCAVYQEIVASQLSKEEIA